MNKIAAVVVFISMICAGMLFAKEHLIYDIDGTKTIVIDMKAIDSDEQVFQYQANISMPKNTLIKDANILSLPKFCTVWQENYRSDEFSKSYLIDYKCSEKIDGNSIYISDNFDRDYVRIVNFKNYHDAAQSKILTTSENFFFVAEQKSLSETIASQISTSISLILQYPILIIGFLYVVILIEQQRSSERIKLFAAFSFFISIVAGRFSILNIEVNFLHILLLLLSAIIIADILKRQKQLFWQLAFKVFTFSLISGTIVANKYNTMLSTSGETFILYATTWLLIYWLLYAAVSFIWSHFLEINIINNKAKGINLTNYSVGVIICLVFWHNLL